MSPLPPPGTGSIHLLPSSQFSHLSFSYPLKLLSPLPLRSTPPGLRVVYMLSYGGGLISGDKIWIDVVVEGGATLVVLTQGTTKVFKRRPRGRLATSAGIAAASGASPPPIPVAEKKTTTAGRIRLDTTTQTLITTLNPRASLYLLPSPTACFVSSRYTQRQRFDLPTCGTANLVVLDWFTCGREKSTGRGGEGAGPGGGESWGAERMEFFAEVWWGGKRGVGERIVLEDENVQVASPPPLTLPLRGGGGTDPTIDPNPLDASPPSQQQPTSPPPHLTSYSSSLLPYTLYTTLLLTGPALQPLLTHLLHLQASEPKIMMNLPHNGPRPSLLWSLSILDDRNVEGMGRTGMVRVCGVEGEEVKRWLEESLGEWIGGLVGGREVWERAVG